MTVKARSDTVTLIRVNDGTNGTPGAKGADGKTSYIHFAYANSADGSSGFSVSESSGKLYIGQYTDFTSSDSTDPKKYSWTKIKGETGDTGATGTSVISTVDEWYLSTSSTALSGGSWSSTKQMWSSGHYYWRRVKTTYSNGTTAYTPTANGYYDESMTSAVSNAESAKETVDNIQIGGRNLILSSKGEWIVRNDSTNEVAQYFSINNSNGLIKDGVTVTLSADIKTNGHVSSIEFFVYDKNTKNVSSKRFVINPETYQRISATFTINDHVDGEDWSKVSVRFDNNGTDSEGTTAILYVRNPKLELGNKPTDWTPAPEDVQGSIDAAQSTADSAKTSADTNARDLTNYIAKNAAALEEIQAQIDGSIMTWFFPRPPEDTNEPTSKWTTTDLKNQHLGDLYYDTDTGYCYRYQVEHQVYSWQRITDVDVTKALADAKNAQDTADGKRRVFTVQPTPPYDVGDLWAAGANGDIKRCRIAKTSEQSYAASDWELASKYTDDTTAKKAQDTANGAITAAATAKSAADGAKTAANNAQTAANSAKTAADKAKTAADKANSDLAKLTDTVTEQGTKIDQNAESISSVASRTTTVENKFTGYYTKIETDSKITQTAEGINSTVSKLDNELNDLWDTSDNLQDQQNKTSDSIKTMADDASALKDRVTQNEQNIAAQGNTITNDFVTKTDFNQKADNLSANVTTLQSVTNAQGTTLKEIIESLVFDKNGLTLTDSSSDEKSKTASVNLKGKAMTFRNASGQVIATFSDNVDIANLVIRLGGTFTMGNFAFIPRSNGNLSIKYIGG